MQSGIARCPDALGGEEPVAEVGLRRRARADRRPGRGEEVELGTVGMRRVHDRRPLAEAAGAGEELDRPAAVLGEALLDLPRLLVRVDVERELLGSAYAADLLEPVGGARADGVGGDADAKPALPQLLDLVEVRADRLLPEARRARRARRRRGGGRARCRPRRRLGGRVRLRERRGSGTRRRPCSRPRASRGTSPRTSCERAPASAARPRRASPRATPRSRLPPRAREAPAGTCGCARSRTQAASGGRPRGRRYHGVAT